jgi:signal transduction histidine kinase
MANKHVALAAVILLPVTLGRQFYLPDSARWGTAALFVVFVVWAFCLLEFVSRSQWISLKLPNLLFPAIATTVSLLLMTLIHPTVFVWVIPAMFLTFMRAPWKWAMATGFGTMLVAQAVALTIWHADPALFVRISLSGYFSIVLFTLFFRTAANTRQQLNLAQANLNTTNQSLMAANQELDRHREHLEAIVRERTRNLEAARSEAESANAVKSRFMANVSHEMRSPLQGILGYAEVGKLNLEDATTDDLGMYFDQILVSGNRMHKLVEGLLTLANKAWDEHASLNPSESQEIDVASFSHAVGILMGLRAEKFEQNLIIDIKTTSATLLGAPSRLQQVFEHLIGNAVRYSTKGATTVWRVSETVFTPRNTTIAVDAVLFEVLDEGCGIPESEIKAVFEPFYESTRTATGAGGTGLGLALSQCIVARHGGLITLTNRAESGLHCKVILPVGI